MGPWRLQPGADRGPVRQGRSAAQERDYRLRARLLHRRTREGADQRRPASRHESTGHGARLRLRDDEVTATVTTINATRSKSIVVVITTSAGHRRAHHA